MEKICLFCHKEICGDSKNSKFCNNECYRSYQKEKTPAYKICLNSHCDKMVNRLNAKYCSRKCCIEYIAEKKHTNIKKNPLRCCKICDVVLTPIQKKEYCSVCVHKGYVKLIIDMGLDELKLKVSSGHKYCQLHKLFYHTFCDKCRSINQMENKNKHKCGYKGCSILIPLKKLHCKTCLPIYMSEKYSN